MPFTINLILIQNVFLVVLLTFPTWIFCKGKKKAPVNAPPKSAIAAPTVKSTIKSVDGPPSVVSSKNGEKKVEEGPKEGEAEKKEGDENAAARSQKPFPKFEMPTESKKKAKIRENEADKKEKIKKGFFQEKSDDDDTLEKIESLKVEQSDKTKRSQKKKA